VWDDDVHVARMRAAPAYSAFEREPDGYRRPLVLLSYWVQSRLGRDDAASAHAVNIALHAANGALLFWLLTRLGAAAAVAVFGSALFVAHPLQWAAVAYVSGRTDLLAALFMLLASHFAVLAARARTSPPAAAACGAVIAIAGAALSKESGLLTGPVAAALWWTERSRLAPATMRRRLEAPPSVVMTAGVAAVTLLLAWYVAPPALASSAGVPLGVRLRAAGAAATGYAELLAAPAAAHLDRLRAVDGARDLVAGAVVVCLMLAAAWAWARRPTLVRFGLFGSALLALPASNVFPIHPAIAERWVFCGEQLMYLPLAALGPLAVGGAAHLLGRVLPSRLAAEAVAAAASVVLVLAWSRPVVASQRAMRDAESVYRNTLAHSPSPRACFNLGVVLLARGDSQGAADVYVRCAAISPSDATVWMQLGVAYQRLRDRNKAELAYAKAVELDPRDPWAWSNYASLDATFGQYDDARRKWERALALDPGFAPAREGLEKLKLAGERAPRPPA
jgi:tetratricopeptide (TPR) repeat protein